MTRRQRTMARVLLVLYLVAVAWLCFGRFDTTPDIPRTLLGIPLDKIVHFVMFFPFPVLAFFAFDFHTAKAWHSVLCTLATFFAGALLAAATEIGQARLTTWRSGDPADFRADLLALAAASILILVIDLWKQRK